MDHRKYHFSKIRIVLSINGALLSLLHCPRLEQWNKELVAPLVQWVPSSLRRCGMTNEEFPATRLPSPELTGTSELVPGSRYHHDGQKHQGPEKTGGYTQKRMQSNPECNKAFWLQRPSPLKDASLSLLPKHPSPESLCPYPLPPPSFGVKAEVLSSFSLLT